MCLFVAFAYCAGPRSVVELTYNEYVGLRLNGTAQRDLLTEAGTTQAARYKVRRHSTSGPRGASWRFIQASEPLRFTYLGAEVHPVLMLGPHDGDKVGAEFREGRVVLPKHM